MEADTMNSVLPVKSASLPPALAAMHGKSTTEILADLNKTPLFMTDLEENDELEAFKALAYEGTPAEVGLNFKERGNECFKEGKWADAKEFYTKGIQVLQAEQRKRASLGKQDQDDRHPSQKQEHNTNSDSQKEQQLQADNEDPLPILEALLVNRAATHLSLRNYRSCTLDCAAALTLNPTNLKAHYRSATALLALSKIPEADTICARGLSISPTNASLLALAQDIIAADTKLRTKLALDQKNIQRKQKEGLVLNAALKARGIKTRSTPQPPELHDAAITLHPDPADPASELTFPTLFLYPLHLQSDFISSLFETEPLGERLAEVLAQPPDWDTEREYTPKGVECYMENLKGGLVKVGRKVTLLGVLGEGSVEVVDGVVRIFVLPKQRAAGWVGEWKVRKGKGV